MDISTSIVTEKSITISDGIVKHFSATLRKKLPKEIVVKEISAAESRGINREYRGRDKPANVLSFFYSKEYGEILVCPEVIWREAKERGNTQEFQMTWMIVHGMIHLAGVHHEKSAKAERKVEDMERKILGKLFPEKKI